MTTLQKIRDTKQKNERYYKQIKDNYKSPSGITLFGKMMKEQNIEFIKHYVKDNNLSQRIENELLDEFVKLNFYCPTPTPSTKKELEQFNDIHKTYKLNY